MNLQKKHNTNRHFVKYPVILIELWVLIIIFAFQNNRDLTCFLSLKMIICNTLKLYI